MKKNVLFQIFILITFVDNYCQDIPNEIYYSFRFKYNQEILEKNKTSLINSNNQKSSYNVLIGLAEDILKSEPESVVSKTKPPYSGEYKDYYSIGPYWWPDTTKPDGLPWINRDGIMNPYTMTQISDFPKMKRMCCRVHTLTLAWFFSDNLTYASKAAELLRTWFINEDTGMNPNLNFAQAIPGRVFGRGTGIIESSSLIRVIESIKLLKGSDVLEIDELAKLEDWFRKYIIWLETSKNGIQEESSSSSNHGTWYDLQIIAFSNFIGDSIRELKYIKKSLTRIPYQVTVDGIQPNEFKRTKSMHYAIFNLLGWYTIAQYAEEIGIDIWNNQNQESTRILKATYYILPYISNIEVWPNQQVEPVVPERILSFLYQVYEATQDELIRQVIKEKNQQIPVSLFNLIFNNIE